MKDGRRGDEMWLRVERVSNAGALVIVTLFTVPYPMALHESEETASGELVALICPLANPTKTPRLIWFPR